jgi:1,4-alpha-glucan branching enzyme
MKKKIFLLSMFGLVFFVFAGAQLIETDPAVPVTGQPIKVYYNTDEEQGALKNFTGDLYTHTGVILEGSSSWKHVIGSWNDNGTQPKLTYLGNWKYELVISPDVETYYSIAEGEKVVRMAFVFRNSASDKKSADLFVDVFEPGLNIKINSPDEPYLVVELNDTITVSASATAAQSVSLYINNDFITQGQDQYTLNYNIIPSGYGEYWARLVASGATESVADSFFYYVTSPAQVEDLSAGLKDGINYTSDTSVTLVLYAPGKEHVFVIGDFIDWFTRESGHMKVTADSKRHWLQISGLTPGVEYRFQYVVDGNIRIADPYADKILDPWNDPYIPEETYPGLIDYPDGLTSGVVSVLQTKQEEYQWHDEGFQPPEKTGLVIYELLIRDFLLKHDYRTLTDTLDWLTGLGITAVELMPVNEFEGNLSWGYNPSFYFAPDKYYGPKNDLKAFIDSCHSRGIAVIMDIVLNHSYGLSPLVQLYFDKSTGKTTPENPWYNVNSPNPVFSWGYDFNHESQDTKDFVDRVNAYWLAEYHFDGFRFDFTKGFTNTPGEGSAYDASRISILKRMADQIWNVDPLAYVILEHFSDNTEEKELAEYGMMLWGNLSTQYGNATRAYTSDLSGGIASERGWNVPNLVTYMESHDQERLMYKNLTGGLYTGDYDTRKPEIALRRMELAAVFFLTLPGPKMIWQFGELGYDYSIDYNGRTGEKPIKWNYFWDTNRKHVYQVYKFLNELRNDYEVFNTSDYDYGLSGKQKRINLNHPDMNVAVLGNFATSSASVVPAFQETGTWYEYFSGDSLQVSDVNAQITLEPGEYRLYTDKELETPEFILGMENQGWDQEGFGVMVYPNPSQQDCNILISSPQPLPVTILINDITGKELRKLATGITVNGTQIFTWDGTTEEGTETSAGIYLLQILTPLNQRVIKVIR